MIVHLLLGAILFYQYYNFAMGDSGPFSLFFPFRMCVPPVYPVDTLALVQTRWAGTFVDIDLTVEALEAGHTMAGVHGDVVLASGTILTGMLFTLIDLSLTVSPYIWGWGKRFQNVRHS